MKGTDGNADLPSDMSLFGDVSILIPDRLDCRAHLLSEVNGAGFWYCTHIPVVLNVVVKGCARVLTC
jgi:hypothetical protein